MAGRFTPPLDSVSAPVAVASLEAALVQTREQLDDAQAELAARDASLEVVTETNSNKPTEPPAHVKASHREVLPSITGGGAITGPSTDESYEEWRKKRRQMGLSLPEDHVKPINTICHLRHLTSYPPPDPIQWPVPGQTLVTNGAGGMVVGTLASSPTHISTAGGSYTIHYGTPSTTAGELAVHSRSYNDDDAEMIYTYGSDGSFTQRRSPSTAPPSNHSIPPSIIPSPASYSAPIFYTSPWPNEPLLPTDYTGTDACVVCLERRAMTVCVPCGHIVHCVTCSNRDNPNRPTKCPTCNAKLTQIIRVYLPE